MEGSWLDDGGEAVHGEDGGLLPSGRHAHSVCLTSGRGLTNSESTFVSNKHRAGHLVSVSVANGSPRRLECGASSSGFPWGALSTNHAPREDVPSETHVSADTTTHESLAPIPIR